MKYLLLVTITSILFKSPTVLFTDHNGLSFMGIILYGFQISRGHHHVYISEFLNICYELRPGRQR